jgi:predicted HTH transcriptional regulator
VTRRSEAGVDTETLERILEGAEESEALEFKGAMPWSRDALVKDILAMANVINGGRIIVGVEDGTFCRQGLTDEQLATYRVEEMRDGIAPFADPRVVFRCDIAVDRDGKRYAIIDVSPFDDVPVICRRDGRDVHAGTIYYRGRSRRPQSARVDNSSDMRDIVERAAALSAKRLARLGFVPGSTDKELFDQELGDL